MGLTKSITITEYQLVFLTPSLEQGQNVSDQDVTPNIHSSQVLGINGVILIQVYDPISSL